MKVVLPLAGRGSRIFPIGLTTHKCLIKVLNKPLLLWTLEALQENGINEAVMVINYNNFGQEVIDYVESLNFPGFKFYFTEQKQQLGTAHALQMAEAFFEKNEELLFLNGDDLYSPEIISELLEYKLAAAAKEVDHPERWGIFQVDGNNDVVALVEKPKKDLGNLGNIGAYKLDARVFGIFDKIRKSPRGEYEVTDSITMLARLNKIRVVSSDAYWQPVGYPWHLLESTKILSETFDYNIEGVVEDGVTVKGNIHLPKSSRIKAGVYIEGNLIVGENTIIGPTAHIRESVVIGDNCIIGFATELKNCVIGNRTFIKGSYVGDSVFGSNVNFPYAVATGFAGAVPSSPDILQTEYDDIKTLSKNQMISSGMSKLGCMIGDNCRFGIGTLIYPGVKIWPNSYTDPREVVKRDMVNLWG